MRDSIRQIAKDLGVSDQTLRNWVNQADVDAGKREGLTTEERTEFREPRKENRKLREEREIPPRMRAMLARRGVGVGQKRVARRCGKSSSPA